MSVSGHPWSCRCVACKTYEGQSAANREAERRDEDRRSKANKEAARAALVAEDRQIERDLANAISSELAAEAMQRESDTGRHREHVEHMEMLAKVREAQLMQTPDGRKMLAQEARERRTLAEKAARAAAREREGRAYRAALDVRGAYYQKYEACRHPEAKSQWLPRGKSALWVAVSVLVAAFQTIGFGGGFGAIMTFVVAVALLFVVRPTKGSHVGGFMVPLVLLVASIASWFCRRIDEMNWAWSFVALGLSLVGVALIWIVLSHFMREDQRDAHSRVLRSRDVAASKDPDALVASVLGVDVERVRLPVQYR